jgi:hypothetical protein
MANPTTYIGWAATSGAGGWHPLSIAEAAYWGATYEAIVTWEDLPSGIATATAQILGITSLAPGQMIGDSFYRLITPFLNANDAAQTNTTVLVGDTVNNLRFFGSISPSTVNVQTGPVVGLGNSVNEAYTAADTLQITFQNPASGKSLSNITQGEARFYFRVRNNNLPG